METQEGGKGAEKRERERGLHNLVKVLRPKLFPSMPAPPNGSPRMLVSFGPAPSEKGGGGVSLFCGITCFRVRRRPLRTVALAIDWIQHLILTSLKTGLQKGRMKCGVGRVQSLQKNQGSVL